MFKIPLLPPAWSLAFSAMAAFRLDSFDPFSKTYGKNTK